MRKKFVALMIAAAAPCGCVRAAVPPTPAVFEQQRQQRVVEAAQRRAVDYQRNEAGRLAYQKEAAARREASWQRETDYVLSQVAALEGTETMPRTLACQHEALADDRHTSDTMIYRPSAKAKAVLFKRTALDMALGGYFSLTVGPQNKVVAAYDTNDPNVPSCQWVIVAADADVLSIAHLQLVHLGLTVPLGNTGQLRVEGTVNAEASFKGVKLAFEERKKVSTHDSYSYRGPQQIGFVGSAVRNALRRAVLAAVAGAHDPGAYLSTVTDEVDDGPFLTFKAALIDQLGVQLAQDGLALKSEGFFTSFDLDELVFTDAAGHVSRRARPGFDSSKESDHTWNADKG